MSKRLCLLLGLTTLAASTACTPIHKTKKAQYWQRISASESTYLRGPKAQETLNRDIARCVTELRELERLGQIRDAIPANTQGRVLDPDELEMARIDTPERNGALYMEHGEYQDFESCMYSNGWERAVTVPFDGLERADFNYTRNHVDYKPQENSRYKEEDENFGNLNN